MRPVAPRALALLITTLESSQGRIVEETIDTSERDALHALKACDAIVTSEDVPYVLCPVCGDQDVEPKKIGQLLQGLCPECGWVRLTNTALRSWQFDAAWLMARLRMAFGIDGRQDSVALAPDFLWKIGDYKQGRQTRRILFARRLSEHRNQCALRETLTEKVERDSAVLIATTSKSAAMVSDIALPYLHLAEIVHFRSGKFELDHARWEWSLKPAHLRQHTASAMFFDNYRLAVLDGEEYAFSASQAAVFAYLHAAKGRKCYKDSIMHDIHSPQKNPLELFRHNQRQLEAFTRLVEWDEFGYYRLKPL